MNIRIGFEQGKMACPVVCPVCRHSRCRRHGTYVRRGFHAPNHAAARPVRVLRYRCLNPDCRRRTFSILPPFVLPYCRFHWSSLRALRLSLSRGVSIRHLARHVWHVTRAVIVRAAALLAQVDHWVEGLHREVSDGQPGEGLERMVKTIIAKIGYPELVFRWYRHRYFLRAG